MIKVIKVTSVAVFVVCMAAAVLSLFGLVKFVNPEQQQILFDVGIRGTIVGLIGIIISSFKKDVLGGEKIDGEKRKKIDNRIKIIDNYQLSYYIGVDFGRYKLDCCILKISINKEGEEEFEIIDGSYSKAMNFLTQDTTDIIALISSALESEFNIAKEKNISIKGIGFGLPGQIDPNKGFVSHSPGFEALSGLNFYEGPFSVKSQAVTDGDHIFVAIDNDVRCATRFLWKEEKLTDAICIFDGSGLGSGMVLDSKLYYGSSFTAGEIGHTTIAGCFMKGETGMPPCFSDILSKEQRKCNCERGNTNYHLETLLSSDGITKIAENLNKNKYQQLLDDMKSGAYKSKYSKLLEKEEFADYKTSIENHIEEKEEIKTISTFFLSLAYYGGDEYANQVVDLFNEYFAIGLANYINLLNPKTIYLGGGIAKGFYKTQLHAKNKKKHTHILLEDRIKFYCLSASSRFDIEVINSTHPIAPKGAAMIFIDETYRKKITSGMYYELVYKQGKFCK